MIPPCCERGLQKLENTESVDIALVYASSTLLEIVCYHDTRGKCIITLCHKECFACCFGVITTINHYKSVKSYLSDHALSSPTLDRFRS